jgi:hypothetical protein
MTKNMEPNKVFELSVNSFGNTPRLADGRRRSSKEEPSAG